MSASSMRLDQWFGWAGQAAILGWLILIFAPRGFPGRLGPALFAIPRFIIPLGISLIYTGFALPHIFSVEGDGFGSLQEVAKLLAKPEMLLAGWVHYLAFDLFIGGWIAAQADRIGLSRMVQAPILATTFMLGPVGLATFLVIKGVSLPFVANPSQQRGSQLSEQAVSEHTAAGQQAPA